MKRTIATVLVTVAASLAAQDTPLDPAAAGPADRIWCANMAEQQVVSFRRRFRLPEGVTTARLVFTGDNESVAWVNGNRVARCADWQEVAVVDLQHLGRDNAIAIEVTNTGGPGAMACWLSWTDAKGAPHALVSDPNWRVATDPAAGWTSTDFDDAKWAQATANFTTTFGLNLYNGKPTHVRFHSRFARAAEPIERALEKLRAARSPAEALAALDALERATMAARREFWKESSRKPDDRR